MMCYMNPLRHKSDRIAGYFVKDKLYKKNRHMNGVEALETFKAFVNRYHLFI